MRAVLLGKPCRSVLPAALFLEEIDGLPSEVTRIRLNARSALVVEETRACLINERKGVRHAIPGSDFFCLSGSWNPRVSLPTVTNLLTKRR